jgi:hypothetical protein
MKYTYTILRYIHDVAVGEFVNVCVIVHCQEYGYLRAKFCQKTTRISRFFPGFDKRQYKQIISHIEHEISLKREFKSFAEDAKVIADSILPIDDSSFQFTELKGGLANNFEMTLSHLYNRFIGK